jgi:hypothetical protein
MKLSVEGSVDFRAVVFIAAGISMIAALVSLRVG